MMNLESYLETMACVNPIQAVGCVTKVSGLIVESQGPTVKVGSVCCIDPGEGLPKIKAEVIGFSQERALLMPLEEIRGIASGSRVAAEDQDASTDVGQGLLGRVIDGLGNPIDGKGFIAAEARYPIYANPVNPLSRQRIRKPLDTGIRALNGLLTIGSGQRIGIFAGSGVGKSTLLGMIARQSTADVNVVALIGERGKELNDFIEKDLGEEGLRRSVVVVATSDKPPLIRMRGAFIATAIAEYFRDRGGQVVLMMDSVTRFAMAQREVGLAAGEPPTTRGYTPSVFTLLPRLLERAGTTSGTGSITGLYTVLVEGDDMNDPIADATRGILDGHAVLSRDLADRNHYPAIDVLASISRTMIDVATPEHRKYAGRLKEVLATYGKVEDLINIGAYVAGSNPEIDYAISMKDRIEAYLKQDINESINFETSVRQLGTLFRTSR
jgi:flagellum-specific ATP synthase